MSPLGGGGSRLEELSASGAQGLRLDRFLAGRFSSYSRSHLKGLIERGLVLVDGARLGADYPLKGGENISVLFPEPVWGCAGDFEAWVLHEDRDLLVLDKPAGLLMHPLGSSWLRVPEAAAQEPEANLAGLLWRLRPGIVKAGLERCGLVHRLDRQTSGVLLVTKTREAQENVVAQFKERTVAKVYRAIVRGCPRERTARVEAAVGRRPRARKITATPFGRPAETGFRVLGRAAEAALIEARPLTGRTHQIRAHLAFLGHPVLGDPDYQPSAREARSGPACLPRPPRLMLHAWRIEFRHPGSRRPVSFQTRPPRDFRDYWALCRKT